MDILPTPYPFQHYQPLTERAPFAIITEAEIPHEYFLYLAGAARVLGVNWVLISSIVDPTIKLYLGSNEDIDANGYQLVTVIWSENPAGTKAVITKDGKQIVISFLTAIPPVP